MARRANRNRAGRAFQAILLCAVALAGSGIVVARQPAVASAPRALVRYTSRADGYSLLLPAHWVRVPGVRWTPAGPPADLTLMTPDRQAALGIMMTPTGRTTYTRAERQGIAVRLLYQEDDILPSTTVRTQTLTVNGVSYDTASAYLTSGLPDMSTFASVAVTQRNRRLYAVVALVYIQLYTLPRGGPEQNPTETPAAGRGTAAHAAGYPAVVAAPTAAAAAAAVAARPGTRSEDRLQGYPVAAPVPPSSGQWRGNRCPSSSDAGLAIADKNCAWEAEYNALHAAAATLTIAAHAPADALPAARVGVDGFARSVDPSRGYMVAYPAQWTPVSVPSTDAAARSPDGNVLVAVGVQSIGTPSLGQGDLRSVAAAEIGQVGNALGNISYTTATVNGILYLVAFAPGVSLSTPGGGLGQARVSVAVAADHHRLYSTRGIALMVSSTDATPVLSPYFDPFTAFARAYQTSTDTHLQEAGLALQTTLSLIVDPRIVAP